MKYYPLREINKRLKKLGAQRLHRDASKFDYATFYYGKRIPGIKVTHGRNTQANEVPEYAVQKLARRLSKIAESQQLPSPHSKTYFVDVLKGKKKIKKQRKGRLEDILILLLIFSGLCYFSGDITGFTILTTQTQKSFSFIIFIIFLSLTLFFLKEKL